MKVFLNNSAFGMLRQNSAGLQTLVKSEVYCEVKMIEMIVGLDANLVKNSVNSFPVVPAK